jgi:mannose-1-phosphate guanylyltransferase
LGDANGSFVAFIMAGSKVQRSGPLSIADRPKQFLDLKRSGRTLIQAAYDRLIPLTRSPDHVYGRHRTVRRLRRAADRECRRSTRLRRQRHRYR